LCDDVVPGSVSGPSFAALKFNLTEPSSGFDKESETGSDSDRVNARNIHAEARTIMVARQAKPPESVGLGQRQEACDRVLKEQG
jgi:hypothetical protein